jgi:hypothetical protein
MRRTGREDGSEESKEPVVINGHANQAALCYNVYTFLFNLCAVWTRKWCHYVVPVLRCEFQSRQGHRVGQNSTLRGVKTTPISVRVRKKKQRLEVVRGVHCSSQ